MNGLRFLMESSLCQLSMAAKAGTTNFANLLLRVQGSVMTLDSEFVGGLECNPCLSLLSVPYANYSKRDFGSLFWGRAPDPSSTGTNCLRKCVALRPKFPNPQPLP